MKGFLIKFNFSEEYVLISLEMYDLIIANSESSLSSRLKRMILNDKSVYIDTEQLYNALKLLIKGKQYNLIDALHDTIKQNENKDERERILTGK